MPVCEVILKVLGCLCRRKPGQPQILSSDNKKNNFSRPENFSHSFSKRKGEAESNDYNILRVYKQVKGTHSLFNTVQLD